MEASRGARRRCDGDVKLGDNRGTLGAGRHDATTSGAGGGGGGGAGACGCAAKRYLHFESRLIGGLLVVPGAPVGAVAGDFRGRQIHVVISDVNTRERFPA